MNQKPTTNRKVAVLETFELVQRGPGVVERVACNTRDLEPPAHFATIDSILAELTKGDSYDPYVNDHAFKRHLLKSSSVLALVSGVKGGCGKTTTTVGLVETARAAGHNVVLFESDPDSADAGPGFLQDPGVKVLAVDLALDEGMAVLIKVLVQAKPPLVIVNCRAGLVAPFRRHHDALQKALNLIGYKLCVFWPLILQEHGVRELRAFWDVMPTAQLFPVLNLKESSRNRIADFKHYIDSELRAKVEAQGLTLVMPRGPQALMSEMEGQRVPFSTLAADPASDSVDADKLHKWLGDMRREFGRVFEF